MTEYQHAPAFTAALRAAGAQQKESDPVTPTPTIGGTVASRTTIRKALAQSLEVALTEAYVVYNYQATGFEGNSPVVRVITAGAERPPGTAHGRRSVFNYFVQFWVLYYEEGADLQAAAEDKLDALEAQLVTWAQTHQSTSLWTTVKLAGRSQITVTNVQHHIYLVEQVQVDVYVYG